MPTYEYYCESCNHKFEKSLKIAERENPEKECCPNCKKNTVKQGFFTPPVIADPVTLGVKKPDKGFQEAISRIKEKTGRKDIGQKRWN